MADPWDYIESRADADEMIADAGKLVGVRRTTATGGRADEPTLTPADATTYALRAEFTKRHRDKWVIERTDQLWLVAAGPLAGVDIKPGMYLVLGSTPCRIENVEALQPADIAVLFECQVRT
jgi:hypothetical protein